LVLARITAFSMMIASRLMSTTARSVDEVALIRHTVSHYAPVLIAQNSVAPASVAGPNFFYKTLAEQTIR
jgi:hypothetical protein